MSKMAKLSKISKSEKHSETFCLCESYGQLSHNIISMLFLSFIDKFKIPFKVLKIHGNICDDAGQKMDEYYKNEIDTIDIIDGSLKQVGKR